MPHSVVEEKLRSLPEECMPQIMEYILLLEKNLSQKKTPHRIPGTLKGKIKMRGDFDAPLECFEEYM